MTDGLPPSSTRRFRVAGMSCDGCAERVELALKSVPGVEGAVVDLEHAEVLLRVAGDVPDYVLADAVEESGYTLLLANESCSDHAAPAAPERIGRWVDEAAEIEDGHFLQARVKVGRARFYPAFQHQKRCFPAVFIIS